jgi:RNase P protein component
MTSNEITRTEIKRLVRSICVEDLKIPMPKIVFVSQSKLPSDTAKAQLKVLVTEGGEELLRVTGF